MDFRSFFSAGTAWGTFAQTNGNQGYTAQLKVEWGNLTLRSLQLSLPANATVSLSLNSKPISATLSSEGLLTFATPITLTSNQALEVQVT